MAGMFVHHNWLFLVATSRGDTTPLGGSGSASEEGAPQSTLAECTPLEWESEAPKSEVDKALTQCLASCVLLGWVDGIIQPLPSVDSVTNIAGVRSW